MVSKIAVVTGGNKGVGFGIARTLAKEVTLTVVLAARNPSLGLAAVKELHQQGYNNVEFLQLDITDNQSVITAVETLRQKYKGIDILINNAAIAFYAPKLDEEIASKTINTNYFATLNVVEKFLPLINNGGRVVNVSSMAGYMVKYPQHLGNQLFSETLTIEQLNGLVNQFVHDVKNNTILQQGWPRSSYAVSKTALTVATRILAQDETYRSKNILINAVCPGYVNTEMSLNLGVLTIDQGAETPIYAAFLPADSKINGAFISEKNVKTADAYPAIDFDNLPFEIPK
jgi:NAD(P)-dependent dehydrogenase (short-subunit alcohol dehydrogenase family)